MISLLLYFISLVLDAFFQQWNEYLFLNLKLTRFCEVDVIEQLMNIEEDTNKWVRFCVHQMFITSLVATV